MQILVNSQEMKQCDTNTIEHLKVPSLVLMERAALGVVEEICLRGVDISRCLVVCGLGNNGGDGLAIARLLRQRGSEVTVFCDWDEKKATEQVKRQFEMVKAYQIPVVSDISSIQENRGYTLVIDAVFGIGLSREIHGRWREVLELLNRMEGYRVSVDIPSGVHADDGNVMGCAFRADLTVTFAYRKTGLLLYPGCEYAGEVVVKDIGIDRQSWLDQKPSAYACEAGDLRLLPKRKSRSNKGTYGKVLVVAGRLNMAGAAYFSGKAAAVTGCGLVKIFTAKENRTILQQRLPEAILTTFEPADEELVPKLTESVAWADVVVLGPGLGTDGSAREMVTAVLRSAVVPVVIDADALNVLAEDPQPLRECSAKTILTPHMGEMARLTGKTIREISVSMVAFAVAMAKEYHTVCVLKDARTVTALPDGTYYINTSGNNGMATAGAGDVLTGIIAGLIAQGMKPEEAAFFGAFLHGMAGDVMVEKTGCYSMMASDIIEGIRQVTRKVRKESDYESI